MTEIRIKYPNGRMTVHLENFFPSRSFNKLLKVIDMDEPNRNEHIRIIKSWMNEEIQLSGERARVYANRYADIRTVVREKEIQVLELERCMKAMPRTNSGYGLLREQFKLHKSEYMHLKHLERSYNSSFKCNQRRKERLQKNLEAIKEV